MNSQNKIISVTIAVFLIGIASASLLSYLSNSINADVEIKGPIFYLDGDGNKLLLNEIPSTEKEVFFLGNESIIFETEKLDLDGFYEANFNFIFYAKTSTSDNEIQINISKINSNSTIFSICDSNIKSIGAISKFTHYEINCDSSGKIILENNDKFAIEIFGVNSNESEVYYLSLGDNSRDYGATRIEISKT